MRRLQVVLGHLKGRPDSGPERALEAEPCRSGARQASPEDVVVVHGRRTAIGRGGRGGFKVRPLDLGWGPTFPRRTPSCGALPLDCVRGPASPTHCGRAGDDRCRASRCRTPPPTSFSPRL